MEVKKIFLKRGLPFLTMGINPVNQLGMKMIWAFVILVGCFGCNNSISEDSELDSTTNKLDTLINRVEDSAIVDSIKLKGEVILDSVKSKGRKLINKAEVEITENKKDSTN